MQPSPRKYSQDLNTIAIKGARIISDLISPPMVYAVLGYLLAWSDLSFWKGLIWGSFYSFFVSLLPILLVLYMYKTGRVQDMHMSNTRQRRVPYLVSILGAAIVFWGVMKLGGPENLGSLAMSNMIGLSFLAVINLFWLISSHMASISLATLFLGIVFGIKTSFLTIPLVLIVFWARLVLKRHTAVQLIAGIAVGLFTIICVMKLGLL